MTINSHADFMSQWDDYRKPLLAEIMRTITETSPDLTESIKWNAPNYCDDGKDRLTVMLHKKDRVALILHTGARPKEDKKAPVLFADDTGLLEWNSNIRATIYFSDLPDFEAKKDLFKQAVTRWLAETKSL
jgi:hypothetical protein